MAWVKIDDRYVTTRKIRRAWRRDPGAVGLHVMAMSECALNETDGLVELDWLEEMLPDADWRLRMVSAMVELGLFDKLAAGDKARVKVTRVRKGKPVEVAVTHGPREEDCYILHDYLQYNEARQEAEERRRSDAERKTKERVRPTDQGASESARSPNGVHADSNWTPDGVLAVSASSTRPDPTRPDPLTPFHSPKGNRKRDRDLYDEQLRAWVSEHLPEHPLKTAIGLTRHATSALVGATSVEEIVAYVHRQHPVGAPA